MQQDCTLNLSINETLFQELALGALKCELTPKQFAEELLECAMAARRLEERHTIQPHDAQPARSGIYSLGA